MSREGNNVQSRRSSTHFNDELSYTDEIWIESGEAIIMTPKRQHRTCLSLVFGCLIAVVIICVVARAFDNALSEIVKEKMKQTPALTLKAISPDDASLPPVMTFGGLDNCDDEPSQCHFNRFGNAGPVLIKSWESNEGRAPERRALNAPTDSNSQDANIPNGAEHNAPISTTHQDKTHNSEGSEMSVPAFLCIPWTNRCLFNDKRIDTSYPSTPEKREPRKNEDCSIMFYDSIIGGCENPVEPNWSVKRSLSDLRTRAANWLTSVFIHNHDGLVKDDPLSGHF